MNRRVLRQAALGGALVTLLCWAPGARADFVSSASSPELAPSRFTTLNSWIPYRTEFSELGSYLESAVKSPIGSGVVLDSRLNTADFRFSAAGSDCGPKPASDVPVKLNKWFDHLCPAADAGATGTSSRPGVERNSQTQTCLLVPQQHIHIQVISQVIADSKVVPGHPFQSTVFHPPRTGVGLSPLG
jgi:hypothetical protein